MAERFADWSLAAQFAVAGGAVMLAAMVLVGSSVTARIEAGVVRNTANSTALYMESFLSPLSQDLARSDRLPPEAAEALRDIVENTPLGRRVVSYKIWKPGGLVAASSDPDLVGQRFEPTENLRRAWRGEVRADFENLRDDEDAGEQALGLPLLEIYSPIRESRSGEVIAVAEFYEIGTQLARDLAAARRTSWLTVAAVMGGIGVLLHAIVLRGSRTIDRQRAELKRQLADLKALSQRNTALRLRVQGAAARTSEMNDHALRRIGADLHDGPAQQLALAALRLDTLRDADCPQARQHEVAAVGTALQEAMREIRAIARGLSLPDIAARPVCDIVEGVALAHATRTGTEVDVDCEAPEGVELSDAARICLYRFVQEGLTNAWRHGGGRGQRVRLRIADDRLSLIVSDAGPGFAASVPSADAGMGLAGLRDRVESLGGTLTEGRSAEGGAEIRMALDLTGERA